MARPAFVSGVQVLMHMNFAMIGKGLALHAHAHEVCGDGKGRGAGDGMMHTKLTEGVALETVLRIEEAAVSAVLINSISDSK